MSTETQNKGVKEAHLVLEAHLKREALPFLMQQRCEMAPMLNFQSTAI